MEHTRAQRWIGSVGLLAVSALTVSAVWLGRDIYDRSAPHNRSEAPRSILSFGQKMPTPSQAEGSKFRWVVFMPDCGSCTMLAGEARDALRTEQRNRVLFVFGQPRSVVLRQLDNTSPAAHIVTQEDSGELGAMWNQLSGMEAVQLNEDQYVIDIWNRRQKLTHFLGGKG